MKVVLKEICMFHSCLFLWICIITYANYKYSHAVLYDLVSICKLVVLKLFKNVTEHIKFFSDLWSGIKLGTRNITKILFSKNKNDSCGQKLKLSNHYETADPRLRTS